MEHFGFPGNIDFAADDQRIFMYYSWKAHVFIHLWNNVYNRWITSNFPFRWHRTTSTTSGWKSSIFNRNSSGERRLKFIASREDGNVVNTATTNMYKGSDKILQLHCKWSWWREETPTAHASKSDGEIRQRLQFTVKLSSSMLRYAATVRRSVQCTSRISFQRTEDSLSAFTRWASLGFPYPILDLIKNVIPYFRRGALDPGPWPERVTSY